MRGLMERLVVLAAVMLALVSVAAAQPSERAAGAFDRPDRADPADRADRAELMDRADRQPRDGSETADRVTAARDRDAVGSPQEPEGDAPTRDADAAAAAGAAANAVADWIWEATQRCWRPARDDVAADGADAPSPRCG